MLDQYRVEIDLLRYKQQINVAKAILIPIPIIVPTLFSLITYYSTFVTCLPLTGILKKNC